MFAMFKEIMRIHVDERVKSMPKDKRVKAKSNLSSMQAVTYAHEFKVADRAGGYLQDRRK